MSVKFNWQPQWFEVTTPKYDDVGISVNDDGRVELYGTRTYEDRDGRDISRGPEFTLNAEDSEEFLAGLQAWLEQLKAR